MIQLEEVVFYTIEKAIKSYRQFAQRQIKEQGINITIDQWLILKTISDHPGIMQREIAEAVFKDSASLTRVIDLLVKKKFLSRLFHSDDRRRFDLKLTTNGEHILKQLESIVSEYRKKALRKVSTSEVKQISSTLNKIIKNCKS
jgi:MarR family transcriptional regulator for hemolysin